ncbi:MAG: MarR family transcriptional regulator [Actinomycetota bacterium]|nr:MarR family transcriptional regulator [Actinomycetota bacterium]MDA8293375.1 MarR family transcriptional regulator [Actinomycetota bacterium]
MVTTASPRSERTAPPQGERTASARQRVVTREEPQPALGLGFRLGRLGRALRRDWADELAELALSPPLAAVLRGIEVSPGCSLRALARTLGSDPMNVKRCVDELEERGLVASAHRSTDRRSRTLTLTDSGQSAVVHVGALVDRHESWLTAALGREGRRSLEQAVGRLEVLLGLAAADATPTGARRDGR